MKRGAPGSPRRGQPPRARRRAPGVGEASRPPPAPNGRALPVAGEPSVLRPARRGRAREARRGHRRRGAGRRPALVVEFCGDRRRGCRRRARRQGGRVPPEPPSRRRAVRRRALKLGHGGGPRVSIFTTARSFDPASPAAENRNLDAVLGRAAGRLRRPPADRKIAHAGLAGRRGRHDLGEDILVPDPDPLRTEIEDYNRDDCLSTLRLAAWLEECRRELQGPHRPARAAAGAPGRVTQPRAGTGGRDRGVVRGAHRRAAGRRRRDLRCCMGGCRTPPDSWSNVAMK